MPLNDNLDEASRQTPASYLESLAAHPL